MIELITGHAGSAHVSSADVGQFNAGTIGAGKYVLNTGTKFEAEVQSANLVTIGTGDAVFEGRHVRVSSTESVAIDNGAQGVKRNDIICIKYEIDGVTGVETASLAVVKGTAASVAVDPIIPSGSIISGSSSAYMPLWRIPIDGISAGTPEKLYGDVLTTHASMSSTLSGTLPTSMIPNLSTSKLTSGTLGFARGGTNSSGVTTQVMGNNITLYKWGKVVFASGNSVTCSFDLANTATFETMIPSGFRPVDMVYEMLVSSIPHARFSFSPNGSVNYYGDATLPANTAVWFSAVWLIP